MLEFIPALVTVTASVAAVSLGTEAIIHAMRRTGTGARLIQALDR